MIIDMSTLLEEKEFDLGEALRTDKFNIIFCGTKDFDEVLNEFLYVYDEDSPKVELLIRNDKDPIITKQHSITAKILFPGSKDICGNNQGIPVLFEDGKWFVALGTSKEKQAKASIYKKQISKKKSVTKFLNSVAKELGPDIMDYLNANPDIDKSKMDDIVDKIKEKYKVEEKEEND